MKRKHYPKEKRPKKKKKARSGPAFFTQKNLNFGTGRTNLQQKTKGEPERLKT